MPTRTIPNALNNAVAVLMQAQKYPEAIQLMEKARANGTLKTKDSHYVNLAKLYLITGQASDDPAPNATKAAQVLEDGMAKGVVKPSADTYVLLGQSAEMANDTGKAVDYYNKAAPAGQRRGARTACRPAAAERKQVQSGQGTDPAKPSTKASSTRAPPTCCWPKASVA